MLNEGIENHLWGNSIPTGFGWFYCGYGLTGAIETV